MRQRLSNSIWTSPGRRTACRGGLALASTLLLAGCVFEVPSPNLDGISSPTDYAFPIDETGYWTNHEPTARERAIANSDFSMELVKFTDGRRARSLEALTPDQLVHQYDPDELMQGLNYRLPNIMERFLAYKPTLPKNYKLEVELTKLLTLVKTGNLWSGSWGRYTVDMELRVVARRDDSTVVMQRTYHLYDEQARDSNLGRGPSKERDRARMYDLTESVLRKICEQIGWDLRQRDARVWKIDRKAPAFAPKFGLNQATGSSDDVQVEDSSGDTGVQWLDPTIPTVIVPATPVDEAPAPDGMPAADEPTPGPDAAPAPNDAQPMDGNGAPMHMPDGVLQEQGDHPAPPPTPAQPLEDSVMGPRQG